MTETRRLTTIEHQLESALAAVRELQSRGLRVASVSAGFGDHARVLIADPHHALDGSGRRGIVYTAAQDASGRAVTERFTMMHDAYVFWLIAAGQEAAA
jgi:hypothetical protein